jgi:beta-lactam-binding protein with PASTA domain
MRNWLVVGVLACALAIALGEMPASAHTASATPKCAVKGKDRVRVPNVVGKKLSQAVRIAKRHDLRVPGQGPGGPDPTGPDAVVTVQKPPSGIRVPRGACIGFRTTTAN